MLTVIFIVTIYCILFFLLWLEMNMYKLCLILLGDEEEKERLAKWTKKRLQKIRKFKRERRRK